MKTKINYVVLRVLLYSILFASSFTACKKDDAVADESGSSPSISSDLKNASISSSELSATVSDQHFDFPGPFILTNHCTGEVVTVTGTIGIDMHTVINGNTMNYSEHQQGQLNGTGSLGNTYVTNVNENITLNGIASNNGVFIIKDITIFRMISKGSAPDFFLRRVANLTINSNGTVTADRIDFFVNCPE
jgi:hypothetical protein